MLQSSADSSEGSFPCMTPAFEEEGSAQAIKHNIETFTLFDKLKFASQLIWGLSEKNRGEAFLLAVRASFLTVKLLCLQSLKALIRSTFPL